MTHLRSDELVDAAEGKATAEAFSHLDRCAACRRQAEALADLLRETSQVPVPEPSPLFWNQFSARVREAIADEPPGSGGLRWLRWQILAPIGALALLVLVLVSAMPPSVTIVEPGDVAVRGSDVPLEKEEWHVVADLLGPLDWETAGAAGLGIAPGDADLAALTLTLDERQELQRLITAELQRGKS